MPFWLLSPPLSVSSCRPPVMHNSAVASTRHPPSAYVTAHANHSGYYKTETEFLKRVEEDATAFKPYGTLIHSYSRSASKMANSRKPRSIPQQVYGPEDEEIVDFEVYHVRPCSFNRCGFTLARTDHEWSRRHGIRLDSGSTIGGCSCSSFFT